MKDVMEDYMKSNAFIIACGQSLVIYGGMEDGLVLISVN